MLFQAIGFDSWTPLRCPVCHVFNCIGLCY